MPPIHRYHKGGIVVPVALVRGIDSAFSVSDGCGEEFALHPSEALDLERPVVVPALWARDTDVITDALVLSRARNVLDIWTLSSECENPGETVCLDDPPGESCLWCQSLALRDWCDAVLDRAGFEPPPYCEMTPDDFNPQELYDRLWIEATS